MKSSMIRALFALVVSICCAAFAAAQPIPDPASQGGQIDNLDGQVSPPVQGGAVDERIVREAKIQELGNTVRQAEKVLATETRPSLRGQAIVASCDAKKEISRLRQQLAALGRRQSATEGKVTKLDSRMGKLEKSDATQNDILLGVKGEDGKRTGGYTTWREGVDKLLRGPDEKEGTTDDVRYVLYGGDGDKNVREIAESASTDAGNAKTEADTAKTAAESAKQTAASAAGGWVMWLAIAAILLAAGALVKSFK